jgi:phage-related protein
MANVVTIDVRAQDRASAALNGIKGNVEGLQKKLLGLAVAVGAAATAFVSINAVKDAVSSTQELGSAVGKLSRETGLAAEDASRLLFAFKHVGLDVDEASRSLGIFSKNMTTIAEAEEGEIKASKTTVALLKEMGIQALDTAGNVRPMDKLLLETADRFKAMPDGIEKTGKAMQLFGRSGKDMIPLLNLGSEGMKELGAEADKLGVTLSAQNVASIKQYTLAQRDMNEAVGGLKLVIGLAIIPALTRFINLLISLQPVIREKLGKSIKWLTTVFGAFGTYMKYVVKTGDSLNKYLKGAHTPLAAFFLLMGETVLALKDIAAWFLEAADAALEWGRKIAGLLSDGRSMADNFDKLGGIIPKVAKAIAGLIAAMVVGTVLGFVAAIADFALGIITFPFAVLKNVVGAIGDLVSITAKVVSKVVTITQNVIRTGAAIIEFLADVVGTVFQNIVRTGAKLIDKLDPTTGTVTQSIQLELPTGAADETRGWFANVMAGVLGGLGGSPEVLRAIGKFAGGLVTGIGLAVGIKLGPALLVAIPGVFTGIGEALAGLLGSAMLIAVFYWPVILAVAFRKQLKTFFSATLPRLFTEALPQFAKSLPRWAGAFAGVVSGALVFALLGIPALLITRVAPAIVEAIGGVFQKIGGAFAGLGGLLGGWIASGLSGIGDVVGGIVAVFASLPGHLIDALRSIPGLLAQVPGWIAKAFVSIPEIVVNFSTVFIDFAASLPRWIAEAFGAIPGIVKTFLTGVGGMVGIVASALGDVLSAIASTPLGKVVGDLMGQVAEGFKAGWKWVDDLTSGALTDLTNKAKGILGGIGNVFKGLLDPIQWVIDRIYQLIEAIGRIPKPPDWVTGLILGGPVGGVAGLLKGILGRASGGPASGLTLVGEKGPELLNAPSGSHIYSNAESRQMAGGVTNNVEIHMHVSASGEDVEPKVFRALDKALRRAGFGGSSISAGAFVPS